MHAHMHAHVCSESALVYPVPVLAEGRGLSSQGMEEADLLDTPLWNVTAEQRKWPVTKDMRKELGGEGAGGRMEGVEKWSTATPSLCLSLSLSCEGPLGSDVAAVVITAC